MLTHPVHWPGVKAVADPADVLWRGGVHYLLPPVAPRGAPEPATLEIALALAALARSAYPRDAEAIVATLLCRPDWAEAVPPASALLPPGGGPAAELRYGYLAAAYLQRHWEPLLRLYWRGPWTTLPDLYAEELGLPPPSDDPFTAHWNVLLLAERRRQESGCDFLSEYEKIVHHLEGQWRAEGRHPSAAMLTP